MLRLDALQPTGLAPVTLEIARGACLVVQGPSGSGKTLLLRAIADLDPCPGEVFLDDTARSEVPGPQWRRRVGYVAADSGWWSDRVDDHFEDWSALIRHHGSLGLPGECAQWPVSRLSTGERQRLALLRAAEAAPRVLLVDEPTAGLDAHARDRVEAWLESLRRDGLTLVWVTHDGDQAARVGTRHLTVDGGCVEPA